MGGIPMNLQKIKILIGDDNKDFCIILNEYLNTQADFEVVGIAKDGLEVVEQIESTFPDVVILDIIMPHLDGLGVLERLNTMHLEKRPKVIVLSAVGQDKITQMAMTLGAEYYVVKPFDTKELVARIKAVLRRIDNKTADNEEVIYPNLVINKTNYTLKLNGITMELPPKELELIYFLASNPNKVFTREQLLDQVWGYDFYGDSRTVDVHIKRIREKIEFEDSNWKLKTVWGVGYKFEVS
jgi:sporulation transcription factor Spo0A